MMTIHDSPRLHTAYCSARDREVRVRVPPGFECRERLGAHDISALVCADYGNGCTGAFCPFSDAPSGAPGPARLSRTTRPAMVAGRDLMNGEGPMEIRTAYCSACDCEVSLILDPDGEVDPSSLVCVGEDEDCRTRTCPLTVAPPSRVRDSLEFLPSRPGGKPRTLDEACGLLEEARRVSLGRAFRRARGP